MKGDKQKSVMNRKINEKLIERMTHGDLLPLLDYIKTEAKKIRLEVRQKGKAFLYYKKSKVLDLGLRSYNIDEKYFPNKQKPHDIADKVINNPEQYFKHTLSVVDEWLVIHRKEEFKTLKNCPGNLCYCCSSLWCEPGFSYPGIHGDDG